MNSHSYASKYPTKLHDISYTHVAMNKKLINDNIHIVFGICMRDVKIIKLKTQKT